MLKGKRYKKSNAKQIILSVTALLVILLVAAGITYSWIEGGDTFTIQTGSDTDVQTATKPNTQVKKGLKIDPLSNNTISLNENFDKTTNASQGLYFSPVSGDGENFFFATKFNNDGVASAFRPANTNDIGTKFINYNFNITTEKNNDNTVSCYIKGKKIVYVNPKSILCHNEWVNYWKVFIPRANNVGTELNDDNMNSFVGKPNTICTESK